LKGKKKEAEIRIKQERNPFTRTSQLLNAENFYPTFNPK
jgi:hypothetical protein